MYLDIKIRTDNLLVNTCVILHISIQLHNKNILLNQNHFTKFVTNLSPTKDILIHAYNKYKQTVKMNSYSKNYKTGCYPLCRAGLIFLGKFFLGPLVTLTKVKKKMKKKSECYSRNEPTHLSTGHQSHPLCYCY